MPGLMLNYVSKGDIGGQFVNQDDNNKHERNLQLYANPGPLFTKWADILPQDLVKSRSRKIGVWTFPIAFKFDRQLASRVVEMPVKFQSDMIIITSNRVSSWLQVICRQDALPLSNTPILWGVALSE